MPSNFTRTDLGSSLRAFRRDALYLHRPFPVPDRLSDPHSYLGGLPCLPDGTEWPRNKQNRAMHFLAQIDCASVPRAPDEFPRTGLLLFFALLAEDTYCEDDFYEFCRVLYFESAGISPRNPPADLEPISALQFGLHRKLRFRNQEPRTVPRWPVEFHQINTWAANIPGMDQAELANTSYHQLLDSVMAEQICEAAGLSCDARVEDWPRPSLSAFDIDGDLPFPQCWFAIECIASAFQKFSSTAEDAGLFLRVARSAARDRAAGFLARAQEHDAWAKPPPDQVKAFREWIDRLLRTRHQEVRGDASDAIEEAMLAVLREAARLPERRNAFPPEYFAKLEATHSPLEGKANPTPHIHQMFGHRFPGPSHPRDWDSEENVMLLQLYSDDALPLSFGDRGYLQFVINREDLADRRFDRAFALEDQ